MLKDSAAKPPSALTMVAVTTAVDASFADGEHGSGNQHEID